MLAHFRENFFSAFSYVFKLTTVHVNQSRYDVQSIKKSVAVVRFSCAKNLKGPSSELTELLQGVKIVRGQIKTKKRKKRGYLSEVHCLGQLDKNLFSQNLKQVLI